MVPSHLLASHPCVACAFQVFCILITTGQKKKEKEKEVINRSHTDFLRTALIPCCVHIRNFRNSLFFRRNKPGSCSAWQGGQPTLLPVCSTPGLCILEAQSFLAFIPAGRQPSSSRRGDWRGRAGRGLRSNKGVAQRRV